MLISSCDMWLYNVQSEYVRSLRASADVILRNNEDDVRRSSSEVDSLYSPTALPSADRFDNSDCVSAHCCVKVTTLTDIAVSCQNAVAGINAVILFINCLDSVWYIVALLYHCQIHHSTLDSSQ